MKRLSFFLFLFLTGCDAVPRTTAVMKCPIPGSLEKIQIVKMQDEVLYVRQIGWRPQPGYYSDTVWVSEFTTPRWKRTAIWDFLFHTYTLQYRPSSDEEILTPTQISLSGTYMCEKIN